MFKELEFIILGPGNNLHDRCLKLFEEHNIQPKIKLVLSQLATCKDLAEQGMAASFLCDRLIRHPDSSLYYYKIDSPLMERIFYLVLPDQTYMSRAAEMFIQYALKSLT